MYENEKRKELFYKSLREIKGKKFTLREVDIIACIVNARGIKKIADILVISPKTVSVHTQNITKKIGCNSQDHIIDFIQKSGKLNHIKRYYHSLLVESIFLRSLRKIGSQINRHEILCSVDVRNLNKSEKAALAIITNNFKLANVLIKTDIMDANFKIEFITGKLANLASNNTLTNGCYILLDKNISTDTLGRIKYINFCEEKEYYQRSFELLEKILPTNIEEIIQEFNYEYTAIVTLPKNIFNNEARKNSFDVVIKNRRINITKEFIMAQITILFIIITYFYYQSKINDDNKKFFRIDLILPHRDILLKRNYLTNKIKQKFNADNNQIKIIALVGIGGAGKTVLARNYAKSQKNRLIFEINAENEDTIISSLEHLAYSLCSNCEEYEQLQNIKFINIFRERKDKLMMFLLTKLKLYNNWLIIYDNVTSLKSIQNYFLRDPKIWGDGRIIITTRNSNIANSNYIPSDNIIYVTELEETEKVQLFLNIISNNNYDKSKLNEFLKRIPPYPLDVSIAAHHVKGIKISYEKYLDYISKPEDKFNILQGNILSNAGQYAQSRYDIISLSIQSIMDESPEFIELLLFISMLDSQNIPKALLIAHNDEITIDSFIYYMKKFSLISHDAKVDAISIHRSTQIIILAYLEKQLALKKEQALEAITYTLKEYIKDTLNKNSIIEVRPIINHAMSFLSHINVGLTEIMIADITNELGNYYLSESNYKHARKILENSLITYKKHYGDNDKKTVDAMIYLGKAYRHTGEYEKSINISKKATLICQRIYGKKHAKTAYLFENLSRSYRSKGDYELANNLQLQALKIYQDLYGEESIQVARARLKLSLIYKDVGYLKKSKELLENVLAVYKKFYGEKSYEIIEVSSILGIVYQYMGDYKKARSLLQDTMKFYIKIHSTENIKIADFNMHVANNLSSFKQYEKAINLLNKSIVILEDYFGENHIKTAKVFLTLGHSYLQKGDLVNAKILLNKALEIFNNNDHPHSFFCLELLAEVYKQEYYKTNNPELKKEYLYKVTSFLKKALKIVENQFPSDSPHAIRLQQKLVK